jgi:hypothetical protein
VGIAIGKPPAITVFRWAFRLRPFDSSRRNPQSPGSRNAVAIDTLEIANQLKDAGFTQQQAEATARVFRDFAENELATKRDLKELGMAMKHDLRGLKIELEAKLDKVQAETKLWIMGTGLALAGFMIAALRLFAR